jgi:hypothetical protein
MKEQLSSDEIPLDDFEEEENTTPSPPSSPFEIIEQFQAHGKDEAIPALLFHDEETMCTLARLSGEIRVFSLENAAEGIVPKLSLNNQHDNQVVSIKSLSIIIWIVAM